ncbi:MAG TPA: hypothetical protein PLC98_23850, partial [Anaerolineales bacterium]|nr:hypothetical protein [Anaerolineales bacterium]
MPRTPPGARRNGRTRPNVAYDDGWRVVMARAPRPNVAYDDGWRVVMAGHGPTWRTTMAARRDGRGAMARRDVRR